MATLAELTSAVQQLLAHPSANSVLQLNSNTQERAFEAYVFALCCEAVRRAGGTAVLRGIQSGPNPNPVVFRGAPGSIASKAQDFVYASCVLQGKEFEIHVDVEFAGASSASHELDVSIISKQLADRARHSGVPPRGTGRHLLGCFECKFYDKTPGVSLCRTFIGLVDDCPPARIAGFVSNKSSESIRLYLSPKGRPTAYVLTPLDAAGEDRFISAVEHALRKWASV